MTTAAFIAVMVSIARTAQAIEPDQWRADDWGALAISVVVGMLFGVLAWIVGRRQSDLTQASANVTLREKAGAITTDSLRSLTGPLDIALHVARDALSAMPLFAIASEDERQEFACAVVRAYGALVLNSFPRTASLPLAQIRRLHEDGHRLAAGLHADGIALRNEEALTVTPVVPLIECSLELEHAARQFAESGLAVSRPMPLPEAFIRTVYEPELLVHHNWDAANMRTTEQFVEFHRDVETLREYYAPWYITADGTGEADFMGLRRADSPDDESVAPSQFPRWPLALTHAQIEDFGSYRTAFIARMTAHLEGLEREHRAPQSFAVLAYELESGERLVLDGNHRLAATIKRKPKRPSNAAPPLVYVFVLKETKALPPSPIKIARDGQVFRGFNPDVACLREALAAATTSAQA